MKLDDLKQYIGKYVETTRKWTPEERQKYQLSSKVFGGGGVVTEVFEERGMLWIAVDWGQAWVVDDATEIKVMKEGRNDR